MVQRTGGFRARTRKKLQKKARNRGKISTSKLFQSFQVGDRVIIKQEPAVHKVMPHPRYKSRTGQIIGKQGRAYIVQIRDGGKIKKLLAGAVHLKKVG